MRAVIALYLAAALAGFTVKFDAPPPSGVKLTLDQVFQDQGEARFHSIASTLRLDFSVSGDVSQWTLQVACRGSAVPIIGGGGDIYTRPMIAVNGTTVYSDLALGNETRVVKEAVGKLLVDGDNHLIISMGGDSRSQFLVSSIKLGP